MFKNLWNKVRDFFSGHFFRQSMLVVVTATGAFVLALVVAPASVAAPTAAGVGLFMVATMESFNIFSAMNSSPWTAENFGADEEKAKSCRKYVLISIGANEALGVGAGLLALSLWPVIGTSLASAFMYILYQEALRKGMAAGSTGWANEVTVA